MKQEKTVKLTYLILFIITIIIFIPYLIGHYTTDTYRIADTGYLQYGLNNSLLDGRAIMYLICLIASFFNINIIVFTSVLLILSIFILMYCVIKLSNIVFLYKDTSKRALKIFVILICYYTIFNFTFIENLEYAESFIMSLSIMFYLLAANEIAKTDKINLKALIYVSLGIISYQGTISALLIFSILFILLSDRKLNIKKILLLGLYIVIGIIIDSLIIKIAENFTMTNQSRNLKTIQQFVFNLKYTVKNISHIIVYTGNAFPKYGFITFILIIISLLLLKTKKNIEYKNIFFNVYLITFFGIVFAMLISIYSTTAFYSARIRYSLGALIGIIYIFLYIKSDVFTNNNVKYKIIISIFIIYAIMTSISYITIIQSNIKINKLDKELAYQINNYVEQYEKTNGIKVDKIKNVVFRGNTDRAKYKTVLYKGSCSAIKTDWSAIPAINYFTNKKFKETNIENKEIITELEQYGYICKDDVLYLSIYMY